MSELCYQTNAKRAIGEIIDGEAIIIDLETGTYFSLQNTGSFIWQCLTRGITLEGISEGIRANYICDGIDIESNLKKFIIQLEKENLVIVTENSPESKTNPDSEDLPKPSNQQIFTPPTLNRYEDMQEFLLVDPIHEVDEDGWPSRTA